MLANQRFETGRGREFNSPQRHIFIPKKLLDGMINWLKNYLEKRAQLVPKQYSLARNIIASLDIFLALLIIFLAPKIAQLEMGKLSLTFGLIMLALTTILKIFNYW